MSETRRFLDDVRSQSSAVVDPSIGSDQHVDSILELSAAHLEARAFLAFARFALRGEIAPAGVSTPIEELLDLLMRTGLARELLLARIFQVFQQSVIAASTWRLLQPQIASDGIWRRYVALLARGRAENMLEARGAVELWASQRTALDNGLLEPGHPGFVIRMPTSAGKTRIAELAILRHLASGGESTRVIYVAPYRALADEVESSLEETFADLGYQVSSVLGSFELDALEDYLLRTTRLLITTPEKLSLLVRNRPDYFQDVGLIVLDEGHIIDDRERGARYEILLTALQDLMPASAQTLFISAVIPDANARQFAEWLCKNKRAVISTDWRPTRQLLGVLNWANGRGQINFPTERSPGGEAGPFVPRAVYRKEYRDYTVKLHREKSVSFPNNKSEIAADLAIAYADLGPVLVFTTQPAWAESCAKAIRQGLRLRRQTEGFDIPKPFRVAAENAVSTATLEASDAWLGRNGLISSLLREGIAIHHRGLPEAVRRAVEQDFKAGAFPVLVATNTLAQGVNLPIKTVIVHAASRYQEGEGESDGESVPLTQREFWNICGRAGRAGYETEGQIVFIAVSESDRRTFAEYASHAYEPLQGQLYAMLVKLLAHRLSQEEFAAQLDSELLALLGEETPDGGKVSALLERSFVSIQAREAGKPIEPLLSMSRFTVSALLARIPDAGRRRVFAETGLRASSCELLAEWVYEDVGVMHRLLAEQHIPLEEVLSKLFTLVSQLPEMQPQYSFEADHRQLLLDWVNQTSIDQLREEYTTSESEEQRLHRFIEDYFGYRLPWGMAGCLRIARHVLGINEELPERQRWIPSMVKYGVNTPRACWAMSLGTPTRALAAALSRGFLEDSTDTSFRAYLTWFADLTEEDFAYRFGATRHQARTLNRRAKALIADGSAFVRDVRSPEVTTMHAAVKGLAYEGREQLAEDVEVGAAVVLIRDYSNQYDSNATKVVYRGNIIGYVERSVARRLAPLLDSGRNLGARVVAVARTPRLALTIEMQEIVTVET
ncbi:MAG: DEAD/DEAH box helicase [Candidatus Tectimicrobiota bacterium]